MAIYHAQIFCPAKLNLGLKVDPETRPDGYHNLQTCFQMLSLGDQLSLTVMPGKGQNLELEFSHLLSDQVLSGPASRAYQSLKASDNLLIRAAQAWLDLQGQILAKSGRTLPDFAFFWKLQKEIPIGAGLGGGSSDAAGAIHLLNHFAHQQAGLQALTPDQSLELASSLGADIPFFLFGQSLASASGIGDLLTPLTSTQPPRHYLLGIRLEPMPTARAFQDLAGLRKQSVSTDIHSNRSYTDNDFYLIYASELDQIYTQLKRLGPTNLHLSGSGPSLYLVFEQSRKALAYLKLIQSEQLNFAPSCTYHWLVSRDLSAPPQVVVDNL